LWPWSFQFLGQKFLSLTLLETMLLSELLTELRLSVVMKVKTSENDWLLLIAKPTYKSFPPPPEDGYTLASPTENPELFPEEVEAIKRHFRPPPSSGFITLDLEG